MGRVLRSMLKGIDWVDNGRCVIKYEYAIVQIGESRNVCQSGTLNQALDQTDFFLRFFFRTAESQTKKHQINT